MNKGETMEEQGFKTHHATSLDAIRAFCIQCMGYQPGAVKDCTAGRFCPLYPYRMNRRPKNSTQISMTEAIEMSNPAFK